MQTHTLQAQICKEAALPYLLHLPPQTAQTKGQQWPAILFLHGLGESGQDLSLLLNEGLPRHVSAHPSFPFVVIAPQCPRNTWWPELKDELDRLIETCTNLYAIDSKRLYLTGLSMGGYGAWYYGVTWPDRFAAIVPICGGGYWFHGFPERVAALRNVPVWAFHGAQDDVVPLGESARLVSVLQAHDGDVTFTVYPDAAHDAWTAAYSSPQLYEWLLSHELA